MISFVTGDVGRKLRHHANDIINNKKQKTHNIFTPRPQPYPGDLTCFFFLSAATSAHKYRNSRQVNTAALPDMTAPELTPPIAFRLLYRRHSALSYPYKLGQRNVKQYPTWNMSTVIKTQVDTDHELASNTYIPGAHCLYRPCIQSLNRPFAKLM